MRRVVEKIGFGRNVRIDLFYVIIAWGTMLILLSLRVYGQACCSSGTPLLSFSEIGVTQPSSLQIDAGYEYNYLNSIFNGSTESPNDAQRRRRVHSLLLGVAYGISPLISLSTLFTVTQRERQSVQVETGLSSLTRVRGISDAVALVKFSFWNPTIVSQQEGAVGAGIKFPLGSVNIRQDGITLPADMQLGTGAWDGILWLFGSKGFRPLPVSVSFSTLYRITTKNVDEYKFGNEVQVTFGGSYSFNEIIDATVHVRYRNSDIDRYQENLVPNTGGQWMYGVFGLNLSPLHSFTVRTHIDLPFYRNLIGSQLTTTLVAGVNVFYTITFDSNINQERKE